MIEFWLTLTGAIAFALIQNGASRRELRRACKILRYRALDALERLGEATGPTGPQSALGVALSLAVIVYGGYLLFRILLAAGFYAFGGRL